MTLERGDWFFVLLLLICALVMSRPYVYAIQSDNYRLAEIFKSGRVRSVFLADLLTIAVFSAIWAAFYLSNSRVFWGFLTAMFFFIAEFALYFIEDMHDRKKPFRYTKRAVRAIIFSTMAATAVVSAVIAHLNSVLGDVYLRYLVFLAFPLAYPVLFIATMSVVNIFEKLNNKRYELRASRTLSAMPDLIKIGVTGSYGKTSVKNYLDAMLSVKYNVLSTPASYNTPMGIAKTVKTLDPSHEIFIAEMGARRSGDIKKLMKIVRPPYTVLTSINNQHLETFKTLENIAREKSLVVSMAAPGGFSVVTDRQRERFDGVLNKKLRTLPIYAGFDGKSDVVVSDYATAADGKSVFTLTLDGVKYTAETDLLGAHNAENIAVAAAMAYGLGVTPRDIIRVVSELQPVPHRLQLMEGTGIKIIDDSFNSNPTAARVSLEVLGGFHGRKIVMTPGLVELGTDEDDENRRLGEEIAEVADVVLLIGKRRAELMRQGLRAANYGGEVHRFDSLAEAEENFPKILFGGDVMLILNDLPDVYNE